MSLETLKARALQIKTSVIEESITPLMVGTQFEEINDFIQSGNITHFRDRGAVYYNNGIINIEFAESTLSEIKSVFSYLPSNIVYQSPETIPSDDALVFIKSGGKSYPLLLKYGKQAQYKNIRDRRILVYYNNNASYLEVNFIIIGGANENSVSIEPIYPSIIELTEESPYYNITETTKSNTLITSLIENGLVNISNNLSLAGKYFLFTLESTSNDINFLYGDIDNIAVKGNLINIFYNNSGVPTITILEEFQTIEDYSDITVSVATSSNFLSITPNGDGFIGEVDNTFLDEYPTDGDIVFLKNELEHNGIYRIFQLTETEYSLTLIKKAEELNTIRVSKGREKGVWFSLKVSDEPFTFKKIDDVSTVDSKGNKFLVINKIANAIFYPIKQKYSKDIKFTEVTLMSNCTNISLTIGSNTYDKDTLIDVVIPANTEFAIDDITIAEGELSADANIKFIEL
jgi:hypothetical protein